MTTANFSTWWSLPQSKCAVLVVGVMLLLAILSKWTGHSEPQYSKKFTRQLKRVVNQASKWHSTSRQDLDPVINLVHSNYALAYANVARAMAPDQSIESMTGVRLRELIDYLEEDQKRAIQAVVQRCPELKPSGIYATGNAWM